MTGKTIGGAARAGAATAWAAAAVSKEKLTGAGASGPASPRETSIKWRYGRPDPPETLIVSGGPAPLKSR